MSLARTLRNIYQRRFVTPRLLRRARNDRVARGRQSDRPGVLIMGWYGLETLGDKAILSSILQHIPTEARVIKATYDVAYSRITLQQIGATHVECIGNDLRSFAGALADVDVVLVGGGPLMGSRDMRVWAEQLSLARQLGCSTMVYGCGVGPLDSMETRRAVAGVLEQADVITLRDEIAVQNAESLGVPPERLLLTADPALGLRDWKDHKRACGDSTLRVGISLRSFPRKCFVAAEGNEDARTRDDVSRDLFEAVISAADQLRVERNAEIHLAPMQTHPADDDRELLRLLMSRLNDGDRVYLIEDVDSPAAMLECFDQFDFLIAMRFHSVVFGLLTHTPLVAIDYDMHVGKVTGIMRAMGMADQVIGIGDVSKSSFDQLVMQSVERRHELRRHLAEVLPLIQQREGRNGDAFRELLSQAMSRRLR